MNLAKARAYNDKQHRLQRFAALNVWGLLPISVAECEPGSEAEAQAVAQWQQDLGIEADGMCGPGTWAAARARCFPAAPIPHGKAERIKVYGNPGIRQREDDPRRIDVDSTWKRANLTRIELAGSKHWAHQHAAAEMVELYDKACEVTGYRPKCGGVFVPRFINWDPDNDPSTHTWGIAVDFDPRLNGRKNDRSAMHEHRLWPAVWEVRGWTWGGMFRTTDPMHFQRGSGF